MISALVALFGVLMGLLAVAGAIMLVFMFGWLAVQIFQAAEETRRRTDETWRAFAARHQLRPDRHRPPRRSSGEYARRGVELKKTVVNNGNNSTTYTDLVFHHLPDGINLSSRSVLTGISELFTGPDVPTGDASFDEAMYVRGDTDRVLAALDHKARAAILAVRQSRRLSMNLDKGKLRIRTSGVARDERRLDEMWRAGTAIADALAAGNRVEARLLDRLANDPDPGVRARAATQLLVRPAAQDAVKMALTDEAPEVRLVVARALADLEVLQRLAQLQSARVAVRCEAIAALSRAPGATEVLGHVISACTDELDDDAAWRQSRTQPLALLGKAVAQAAARGEPDAVEPSLLRLLELPNRWVCIGAVRSLGTVGGVRSTAALDEILRTTSNRELRGAARQALGEITERLSASGLAAGAVSIAATAEAGALTLAETELSAQRRTGETERDRQ